MRQFWPTILILITVGCGQQEVTQRTYREIATRANAPAPPVAPMEAPAGTPAMSGSVPTGSVTVTWKTPEDWLEQPGSGVRLVTFMVDGAECTITTFPGDVGGLRANLQRWLGQLAVRADAEQAVDALMASGVPVAGALPGQIFDFRLWVDDAPSATSMLAGILEKSGSTVFVKFTGPRSVLSAQVEAFTELCRSVQ